MQFEKLTGTQILERFPPALEKKPIVKEHLFYVFTRGTHSFVYKESEIPWEGKLVWLVLKNSDFNAGSGEWIPNSLFEFWEDAADFVLKQEGVQGTKQGFHTYTGVSIHGEVYAISSANGYKIQPMLLR